MSLLNELIVEGRQNVTDAVTVRIPRYNASVAVSRSLVDQMMQQNRRRRFVRITVMSGVLAVVGACVFVAGRSRYPPSVSAIAVSSDGKSVAVATGNGYIGVWDSKSRMRTARMSLPGQDGSSAHAIGFVSNDRELVSADHLVKDHFFAPGGEARLAFWRLPSGNESRVIPNTSWPLALSPSTDEIAIFSGEGIAIVDAASGDRLHALEISRPGVTGVWALSFSGDAKSIVAVGEDWLSVWDIGKPAPTFSTELELGYDNFATFLPDGKSVLVIAGQSKSIRQLDRATGEEVNRFPWDGGRPPAISADRQRMVSCGHAGGGVILWDLNTVRPLKTYGGCKGFSHVAISADGKHIAAAAAGQHNFEGVEVWQNAE